jgi:hypothetical protein
MVCIFQSFCTRAASISLREYVLQVGESFGISDLSKVENLETIHSEQEQELEPNEDVMVTNDVSFKEAKIKELLSWKNNNVYVEKEDVGQKCISTRWICNLKDTTNGTIHKASLVARGFEEFNSGKHLIAHIHIYRAAKQHFFYLLLWVDE